MQFVRYEDARVMQVRNPRPNPGTDLIRYYFGVRGTNGPGAQAYMVNFGPGIRNRTHFHDVNQFQIFFGSPGCTYQRTEMGPLMLHYTDGDRAYGPFGAGSSPLRFFTLRRQTSSFVGYLPEDQEKLAGSINRRDIRMKLGSWMNDALPPAGEHTIQTLIPTHTDGLGAFEISAGPAAPIPEPADDLAGGQYYVVIDGELNAARESLPVMTLGWRAAGSDVPEMVAGSRGVRLLVVQFAKSERLLHA